MPAVEPVVEVFEAAGAAEARSIIIECCTDWTELEQYSAAWTALAKAQSPPSFFVSWQWTSAWWAAYGHRHSLFVLICRDDHNRLLAIVPLYRAAEQDGRIAKRVLRWIGDGTDDVDGFGPLVRPGDEHRVTKAIFDWLSAHASEWDLLQLDSMPQESMSANALRVEAEKRGWTTRKHLSPHRFIELPDIWEAHLAGISRKTRQTWLRRIRNAERDFELVLQPCVTADEIDNGLDAVFTLHQKNWHSRGHKGKFVSKERRDFYRAICRAAAESGNLDLWLLRFDGVVCAARLGFRRGNTRHAVIAAMDPKFASYGVGTIIEALVIKECIARGDRIYDFLAGDEGYKSESGARLSRYMNLCIARPRTRAAFRLVSASSIESGKTWLRERFPGAYRALISAKLATRKTDSLKSPVLAVAYPAGESLQLRVFHDLTPLRQGWNGLVGRSAGSSVFQTWEWIEAWLGAYGERKIFVVAGFEKDRLAGLLPLYVSGWPGHEGSLRVLRLLADSPDDAGGLGLIVEAGKEEEFCRTALDWLSAHADGWDAVELEHLSSSPANSALLSTFKERGWIFRHRNSPQSLLEISDTSRNLPLRTDAKRAAKKLGARTVEYRRVEDTADVASALETLFRLHEQRWAAKGKSGALASVERRDFYRLLAVSMSRTGALDLWTMDIDGQTVAAEFGLVCGDTRYSMQAGFDPSFARIQVGMLLDVWIIESAIARGLHYCDFLQGQQEFKSSLGAGSSYYLNIRCAPPRSLGAAWVRASRRPGLQNLWSLTRRSGIFPVR